MYINGLNAPFGVYIVIFTVFSFSVVFIVKRVLLFKGVNINYRRVRRNFILPMFKGFLMSFFISMAFTTSFYYISIVTKYELIGVGFNPGTLGDLSPYYTGRAGLSLFFSGCLLLIIGISLSFKILTPEEARTIL